MKTHTTDVKGWEQLSLIAPRAVEIKLSIGLYAEANHAQVMMEVHDADTGALLVMRSRPHVDWKQVWNELDAWVDRLRELIEVHDAPFG